MGLGGSVLFETKDVKDLLRYDKDSELVSMAVMPLTPVNKAL